MDKLRLRNYRCLEDTGEVEIKPLTLLAGTNSSGKSSFLKFFPLLKQSVGEKVNGVFLWDGQYVDFKDFNNTVRNNKGDIEVEYLIDELYIYEPTNSKLNNVRVNFQITAYSKDQDFLKKVKISYNGVVAEYIFDYKRKECYVKVNTISSTLFRDTIKFEARKALFPHIFYSIVGKYRVGYTSIRAHQNCIKQIGLESRSYAEPLLEEIYGLLDIQEIAKLNDKKIGSKTVKMTKRLTNTILYCNSLYLYNAVNFYFSDMARNVMYIGPLRSNMARYYRMQNKDVTEIDFKGENLVLYLKSLSDKKLSEYNEWLSNNFGISVRVKPSEGHMELLLAEEIEVNLIDAGFGYTQILPIITIIWDAIYNNSYVNEIFPYKVVVIEQPELHLHPKFQRDFANMLMKVVSGNKDKLRLIIETHSAYMLEELESLSQNGMVNSTDVNFVLFNAANAGNSEYIHQVTFGSDKLLHEWPAGFNHITNV